MSPDPMRSNVEQGPGRPLSDTEDPEEFAELTRSCLETFEEVGDDSVLIKPNCASHNLVSTMSPLGALVPSVPSLDRLLYAMTKSIDASTMLSRRLNQNEWNHVFSSLSPSGLGRIIASIRNSVQHVAMATILAARIGPLFTCAHCVTAIQNTTNWNRPTMARLLAPFCTDWKEHQRLLWNEMSPWEQTLCSDALSDRQVVAVRINA
jgi:hypothetical protein